MDTPGKWSLSRRGVNVAWTILQDKALDRFPAGSKPVQVKSQPTGAGPFTIAGSPNNGRIAHSGKRKPQPDASTGERWTLGRRRGKRPGVGKSRLIVPS